MQSCSGLPSVIERVVNDYKGQRFISVIVLVSDVTGVTEM